MKLKHYLQQTTIPYKKLISKNSIIGGLSFYLLDRLSILYKEPLLIKQFRQLALKKLINLKQPDWVFFDIPEINYDKLSYYSKPIFNLNNIDKIKLRTLLSNLGLLTNKIQETTTIIDIIFDSVAINNNQINRLLAKQGIIFTSLFQAIKLYLLLVKTYLGTVVSIEDNFFSALNSAVFSEGSFCYIPKDTISQFDLSTYFRTNTENYAQFERTLIIADENSQLTYLEGCTAPLYQESQLHVAIVEIIVKPFSHVNYSTIQNWYRGSTIGEGGLFNFTTKRGVCFESAQLDWVQVEIGSAITWKYPSTILLEKFSKSNFFSISYISNVQIADTGGKMIHIGPYTKSHINSKSISLNSSINIYRGKVDIKNTAWYAYNYTECDSLLFGNTALTSTYPYTFVNNYTAVVTQEAKISKIDELYFFFLMQRGLSLNTAISLLIYGFCTDVCDKLPFEFNTEIPVLLNLKLDNLGH